ncbi:MAG: hypothetical protein KU37_05210 [Sulfuricurvum sp. PC08-66]|nr:MAG: hypothetical protein KU37_05210 [Sulfuricurvum sp. PC08-66]
MPTQELKLHDIKGLALVDDVSIYYFYGVIALGVLLLALLAWGVWRFWHRTRAIDMQKLYLSRLKAVDIDATKESAYALTQWGGLIEKDLPQTKAYEDMVALLEAYKYKKEVPAFDEATRQKISRFLELIDG